jgi:hypothetical protein
MHALSTSKSDQSDSQLKVGILANDLHTIAVLSWEPPVGVNEVPPMVWEDAVDTVNEQFGTQPSRTIYVIHDPRKPGLVSQCTRLCPQFSGGKCIDFSLRRLDVQLLNSAALAVERLAPVQPKAPVRTNTAHDC